MSKKEVRSLDIKTDRARIAWVLESLKSTSLTGKARIYVDFLKEDRKSTRLNSSHWE